VRSLGLKGFELGTNVAGADLDDPRFAPVFAAAEELGALIFLHPMGFTHGERLTQHYLNNVIGNPLETTIAVSHLIFGGVLDRHPGLKICLAHGGGYLAAYSGRMDHAYRERSDCRGCRRMPSEYLRDLHYDTVVFDRDQLEYLVARYGPDRILLGSDHPFDMGDPDPVGIVAALRNLDPDDLSKILGGNAARLLSLGQGDKT
jgi:aminocarboxymuconate-semialdehyde decarboxylase